MPILLTLRNHPGPGAPDQRDLALEAGEAVIGRGEGVQFLLSSQMVSRRHCVLRGTGDAWNLTDTSTGGTLVNGQRIAAPHALRHGDLLTLGDMEILVTLGAGSPHTAQPASNRDGWGRPAPSHSPSPDADTQTQARLSPARAAYAQQAAPAQRPILSGADPRTLAAAEAVLSASVEALAAMMKARAKARAELGVASEDDAQAAPLLAQDIAPGELLRRLLALGPERAGAELASASAQLEAHRTATLAAMQATFHAALDHFAPQAIRQRTRDDASAWKAYERAFAAQDGFVEVFAQELAKAYRESGNG